MENKARYKVAVKCCTYNQAPYITDTLNGFVMQETDFPFVCCVIDDASTDGEQEVIKKFVADNFNLSEPNIAYETETDDAHITFARHKSNKNCFFAVLYLKRNLYHDNKKKLSLISEWMNDTEYIAFCEGDDYWIDYEKLQIQTCVMDKDLHCALTYTKCKRYIQSKSQFENDPWGGMSQTFEDFLETNTVPTATAICRKIAYNKYNDLVESKVEEWKMGDYPMWLYFSHEFNVKFINRTTSVYRILSESASHFSSSSDYKSFIYSAIDIVDFFVKTFNYSMNFGKYKSVRLSRLATGLAFLYDNLEEAKEIIRDVPEKGIKEYVKLFFFSNEQLFSLYKRTLKI